MKASKKEYNPIKGTNVFKHIGAYSGTIKDGDCIFNLLEIPEGFVQVKSGTIQAGDLLRYADKPDAELESVMGCKVETHTIREAELTIGCEIENYSSFFTVWRKKPETVEDFQKIFQLDMKKHIDPNETSITKLYHDFSRLLREFQEKYREQLLLAWYAEHGFAPGEATVCTQHCDDGIVRCWIEKKIKKIDN